MDFQRRNHGTGHSYWLDGDKLPGVTSILNDGKPKQLTHWAATQAADAALNDWDTFARLPVSDRYRLMTGAPGKALGEAARRGTAVHALAWALITGDDVEVPDEYAGPVQAAVRFMDVLQVVPVLREGPVFHVKHRWAGTFDLLADIDGETWLLDWKTGRNLFDDVALQLAAYNHATHTQHDDGTIHAWEPAQRCGVVHLLPDSYSFHEVDAGDDTYTAFRYCQQVANWTGRAKSAWKDGTPWPIGAALPAPRSMP